MNGSARIALVSITGALALPGIQAGAEPAIGTRGMVSSAHPLATQAGVEILQRGGNAFDAAIATALTLNVVEPYMSGLGGYGTILTYDAESGETQFLNASAHIPIGVDSDAYRAPTPNYQQNRVGAKAVSTPGAAPALEAMHARYGSLPLTQIAGPALMAARDGFEIGDQFAGFLASTYPSFPPDAQAIYGRSGTPLGAGDRLVQDDLARTLELFANEGSAPFRTGEIARAIDRTMREAGGFLAIQDLQRANGEWFEPVSIGYQDHEVFTASPPATAYPSLVRLGLMDALRARELGHNSADYLHVFAEVTKIAFWSRLRYAGEPSHTPPPLDVLLGESWLGERARTIDRQGATPFVAPGPVGEPSEHTTHFVVADAKGNVVSATLTLGQGFGSRIMPEGTGLWLNNSLRYCTFEPAGNPMDAHAGRRKLSGDCPTIVMKAGRPWLVIGTPGGHTIGQTVPQMVMNAIDFGMGVQEAIDAPRISFMDDPNRLLVERAIPEEVRGDLESRGHNVRVIPALGRAHGLTIEYGADGRPIRFEGGADHRGPGVARGY